MVSYRIQTLRKPTFPTAHSITTAHNTNFHQDTHELEPTTNGVEEKDDQIDTESTAEVTSNLPNSGTRFDTQPFASSQSAPEDSMDQSGIELDDAPLDPTPAVVQQPIDIYSP